MKSKLLLGILGAFLAIGCSQERPGADTFNLDVAVEITVQNEKGQNLLDPKTEGAINPEDIKLYYVEDGKAQEVYDETSDLPKSFMIFQTGGTYRMRILQNHVDSDDRPLTLIQWNETDVDTIQSEYLKGDRYIIQDKIYYNGKLSWSTGDSFEPYFEVVKN
ncbi:hypothetical protein INR75_07870 [Zunongwangia sp. SCSIO 43204]|uniref:Lipoprotein n=1 Tax=Zunongwangia mangrovi TaxID=1334022 RepID=A0A1I1ESU3_9FLAO|nr:MULTISPECIES: hypothetical protein [Zunongwangia]UAB85910.1 hypothetical protein INR75_07870 [Zunongwangia sp. SCSIO 43204]SFB90195.1 hypothetical protein SAMN04487907_1011105 [Zunongwangia mangrovi]|tara:strand:+ start:228 stop:713 length:486 start_codon:yes stop_codon:yes gene_type:complete